MTEAGEGERGYIPELRPGANSISLLFCHQMGRRDAARRKDHQVLGEPLVHVLCPLPSQALAQPLPYRLSSLHSQNAANSWGPWWGERGHFRIVRGTNECDIESFVLGVWGRVGMEDMSHH